MAFLLVLLTLAAAYLSAAIAGGSVYLILGQTTALLTVLSSVILLLFLSRWAVLTIGLLAVLQASSYLAYVGAQTPTFVNPSGSDTVVYAVSVTHMFGPLVLMGATGAALLYAAWLWRSGVLR